jgi:hypothetical protein
MKKIARKIAMILVLVMLANSIAGCTIINSIMWAKTGDPPGEIFGWGMLLDAIIIALIVAAARGEFSEAEPPSETGIYLASAEHNPFMDYYSAMKILNSLPETERTALMEKINSLPETKHASLIRTVNSLPQKEITASIERLNALSEAELFP